MHVYFFLYFYNLKYIYIYTHSCTHNLTRQVLAMCFNMWSTRAWRVILGGTKNKGAFVKQIGTYVLGSVLFEVGGPLSPPQKYFKILFHVLIVGIAGISRY